MNLTGRPIYQKGQDKPRKPVKVYRSSKVMQSAKGQRCTADWCGCGGTTDTTVLCHVRKFGIGGMGIKPTDFIGFYGCEKAHRMFDQGPDVNWSWEGVCRSVIQTQIQLNQKGILVAG